MNDRDLIITHRSLMTLITTLYLFADGLFSVLQPIIEYLATNMTIDLVKMVSTRKCKKVGSCLCPFSVLS